jgi:uncharacterized protein
MLRGRHGRAHAVRAGHLLLGRPATSDPVAAKAFYTSLFGWQAENLPGGEAGTYTALRHRGREVAILYLQTREARAAAAPPHWTSYISVDDADATATRAGELGGAAVFRKPFDVSDAGRVAAIRDPTGAIVSLWQPRARIGAALVNDVGALCWNELATTNVERAKPFFGELLGWEYETDDGGYTTVKNAGRSNGGMRRQTEAERASQPNWLPYFAVESAEEATRKSEQLGGRGLAAATAVSMGRFAVIADPQGAPFAVFQGKDRPVGSYLSARALDAREDGRPLVVLERRPANGPERPEHVFRIDSNGHASRPTRRPGHAAVASREGGRHGHQKLPSLLPRPELGRLWSPESATSRVAPRGVEFVSFCRGRRAVFAAQRAARHSSRVRAARHRRK